MKKFIYFLILIFLPLGAYSQDREPDALKSTSTQSWLDLKKKISIEKNENYKKGLSYIISGSSAVIAGIFGERSSDDTIDKGIYSLFQVIGVSSVGYGAYKWKIAEPDVLFFDSLDSNSELTPHQKYLVMQTYFKQKKKQEEQEKVIRAITHSLAAALNIYGAAAQDNKNIRNGLYFLAGVNVLATVSFTF